MPQRRTVNVILLSFGFMLLFVSFQTMSNILVRNYYSFFILFLKSQNDCYWCQAIMKFNLVRTSFWEEHFQRFEPSGYQGKWWKELIIKYYFFLIVRSWVLDVTWFRSCHIEQCFFFLHIMSKKYFKPRV